MKEQRSFSPALIGIVHTLKWRYKSDCTGLEAHWKTALPTGTKVQVMMGPKKQTPHFDDDALVKQDTIVNNNKEVRVDFETTLPSQETFINLRVWGHTSNVHTMLVQSQNQGGFPIAQSPEGPYGWAETTIVPCTR